MCRSRTDCRLKALKAFIPSGHNNNTGGRHVGFSNHVGTIIKKASEVRPCAIANRVREKGINGAIESLDFRSRHNSNLIIISSWLSLNKRHKPSTSNSRRILAIEIDSKSHKPQWPSGLTTWLWSSRLGFDSHSRHLLSRTDFDKYHGPMWHQTP